MSKNMTRKGLAFGAGLSLVVSSFAALPAQATGLTGLITLEPSSGPESALAVFAKNGATFSLTATPASTVMGAGTVKFLVSDPTGKILPASGSTNGDTDTIALGDTSADFRGVNTANDLVFVATSGVADGSYVFHSTSDFVLAKTADADPQTVLAADTLRYGVVKNDTLVFKSTLDITDAMALVRVVAAETLTFVRSGDITLLSSSIADNATITGQDNPDTVSFATTGVVDGTYVAFLAANLTTDNEAGGAMNGTHLFKGRPFSAAIASNSATVTSQAAATVIDTDGSTGLATAVNALNIVGSAAITKLGTSPRAADNSFVVDSVISTAGNTATVQLEATEDNTNRSATVTAWVDTISNDLIAATEYVSPALTVNFVKAADVTWATTLSAPIPGAETLTATITTTPMLNGAQLLDNYAVRALFTRAGSSTSLLDDANATQSDLTGNWTSAIDLELVAAGGIGSNAGFTVATAGTLTAAGWAGGLLTPDKVVEGTNNGTPTGTVTANKISKVDVAATKVVTITTAAAHQLTSGDKVTFAKGSATLAAVTDGSAAVTGRTVTVTSATTFTFTLDTTATVTAAAIENADVETDTTYTVATFTSGDTTNQYFRTSRVFPGDYSANAYYAVDYTAGTASSGTWSKGGSASSLGTVAAIAADVKFTTTGSASVQGASVTSNDSGVDSLIKAGVLTAEVVATVVDKDGAAVGAGRAVVWTMSASAATIKVNGRTTGTTSTTDANGQVKFTVTDTLGLNGSNVEISATAEGVSASVSSFKFQWATQAFSLYDLNTSDASALATSTRYVAPGATYDLSLLMADQWYQPAADADYRVKVSGVGVTEGFVPLTAGKATVKVTDSKVATSFVSKLTIQKKNSAGTFADTTTVVDLTTATSDKAAVTLGADATALYASATVDLADLVAAKALVERDNRVAFVERPAYANDVVIAGKVGNSSTNASFGGAVVTISGPTSIVFSNGAVDKRGSITVVADSSTGEFAVTLYSTTAQTDTVITVTSMGVSSTTKVTFTGIGVGEGTKLDVTTPANVQPASTFQVKAKLSDAFGNGVEATAGRVKVTYTGPGIVFGTLPDKTDKNGELMFSVLLGSNDSGIVTVTVSYDQNGDADFVDAKDLNTTKTITVGAAADSVTIGSYSGRVAVRVEGQQGARLSVKIGKKWYVATVPSNRYVWSVKSSKGAVVKVDAYINGDLENTATITVK